MPFTDFFPPLPEQRAFGIEGFDWDKFKLWVQGEQWSFKKAITIQGDLVSSNWDGAQPLDLSSADGTATAGFALDSSEGSAQFEGDIFLGGVLYLTGGSGYIEVQDTGGSNAGRLIFTSGRATFTDELGVSGNLALGVGADMTLAQSASTDGDFISSSLGIEEAVTGGSGFDVPSLYISATYYLNPGSSERVWQLYPYETSGTVSTTGMLRLSYELNGGGKTDMMAFTTSGVRLIDGSESAPAYSFMGNTGHGMYRAGTTLAFSANGNLGLSLETDGSLNMHGTGVELNMYSRDNDDQPVVLYNPTGNHMYWYIAAGNRFHVSWDGSNTYVGGFSGGEIVLDYVNEIRVSNGSSGDPSYTFQNAQTAGMYWDGSKVMFQTSSSYAGGFVYGGSASSLYLRDGLTDVGNHETLRLNRGSGTTLQAVGYYSSWSYLKKNIKPLNDQKRKTHYWRREWFMDLEPVGYQRRVNETFRDEAFPEEQTELGFTIENLIENTNLLTTKGSRVGDSPDEFALLAVTVDYVQHLEQRVAELERRVAA